MSTKALREKRATIAKTITDMAATVSRENRDFTSVEAPAWAAANSEYDALTTRIETEERAASVTQDQRTTRGIIPGRENYDARAAMEAANREDGDDDERPVVASNEDNALALQGWMRVRSGLDLTQRHVDACRRAGVNPRRSEFDIALNRRAMTMTQKRAMSAIDQTMGGSVVAPTFANTFEAALLTFGGMRQAAQVMRTETGAEMSWPTFNDTGVEGTIVGENVQVNDSNVATNNVKFGAHKYTSGMIKVPVELLEDSAFDLASIVGEMCGERIGRRQNRDFTTGDGASKPTGVITAAPVGVTTAGTAAITLAEVTALEHSVDPAYRNSPSTAFMFHDSILMFLRTLVDSQGRPLWQSNVALGQPDTFNGRAYMINQNMAAAAVAGAITMAFGDFSKYKIRDVQGLRFRRLVERYADFDQEGFVAFFRSDGNLLDAGTHPVKTLQQHA